MGAGRLLRVVRRKTISSSSSSNGGGATDLWAAGLGFLTNPSHDSRPPPGIISLATAITGDNRLSDAIWRARHVLETQPCSSLIYSPAFLIRSPVNYLD